MSEPRGASGSKPVSFSELKSKVGVTDVAASLGYVLDRRAGMGRFVELVLGEPSNPTDRIIVRNDPLKEKQTYFRRNSSQGGDVVSFVRENLDKFPANHPSEWGKLAQVLSEFAGMPGPSLAEVRASAGKAAAKFEPERYLTEPIDCANLPWLLAKRGFSSETVASFGESVKLIKDTRNDRFDGLNVGFPYVRPESGELAGYEIRGNGGFKAKAAGMDSAHSCWIAEFDASGKLAVGHSGPVAASNVYFFESAFDAMAYHQANYMDKLPNPGPFALVSTGGSFNPDVVRRVIDRYPGARLYDCFDNDLAGNIYGLKLAAVASKTEITVIPSVHDKDVVRIHHSDGGFMDLNKKNFNSGEPMYWMFPKVPVLSHKAPSAYKDWNDCILGKRMAHQEPASKYEREENLRKRRSSLKP